MTLRCILLIAALLARVDGAWGYLVGPPLSLEKLAAEADIIFKGTAVSSESVEDEWFKPVSGFAAQETTFTVISVIQGDLLGGTLRFRHYDASPPLPGKPRFLTFQPQYYHFETGRTYVVFAKRSEPAGVFRQLWANHTEKADQGVVLCSDDKPLSAKTVKEALWTELTLLLKSADVSNVTEFEPLFLNALARENPDPYLDALARVVEGKIAPRNWQGGEIPAFTAWKILFQQVDKNPSLYKRE